MKVGKKPVPRSSDGYKFSKVTGEKLQSKRKLVQLIRDTEDQLRKLHAELAQHLEIDGVSNPASMAVETMAFPLFECSELINSPEGVAWINETL